MSYAAGLEMSPPKSGGCWVLTDFVVHYQIGIRDYSADKHIDSGMCLAYYHVQAASCAQARAGLESGTIR
jgi:hypothetical protein